LLLAVLYYVLCISLLRAEETSPNMTDTKSKLLLILPQLEMQNKTLLIELNKSKNSLNLLSSQLTQSVTELTGLQTQLITAQNYLQTSENSLKAYQKEAEAEMSRLKWSRIEWTVGGFIVGVGTGLIIAALVH
jgi:predicted  nucleic acid-binding Zn-ribbon protein